jgi:DNA-directed RNA polymerase specialized sigma24 family protein
MTEPAFKKLLGAFADNEDEAGREYERVRIKLMRVFEWNGVGPADELADQAFNVVARHLEKGKEIDNLIGFIVGVAKVIAGEVRKKRKPLSLEDVKEKQQPIEPEPIEPDARQKCFDYCLADLTSEKRYLIVEYYKHEKGDKIKRRQKLADELGIPMNALRIRAHRIRMGLEKCITRCRESEPGRNN